MGRYATSRNSCSLYFLLFVALTNMIGIAHSRINLDDTNSMQLCSVLPSPPPVEEEPEPGLFDLLSSGEELMKNYTITRNAILVMGNTGVGISTVTNIIAGNLSQLYAVETVSGGDLVIIDEDDRIGLPSTKSKTLVPHLIMKPGTVENQKPLSFFDFPGFDGTRDPIYDVATNYFKNQVTKITTNAKMIFVVPQSAIKLITNDEFDSMVVHATTFVKDIEKYIRSFSLLVNKVVSFDSRGYIEDATIMTEIVDFIQEYNKTLHGDLASANPEDETKISNKIAFVTSLLEVDPSTGENNRIWFVRSPTECGILSESEKYLETRENVANLYDSLEYTQVDAEVDFDFTLKTNTSEHIANYTSAVNTGISSVVNQLTDNLETYYFEVANPVNIQNLNLSLLTESTGNHSVLLKQIVSKLSSNNVTNSLEYLKVVRQFWEVLNFPLPSKIENYMGSQEDYLKFFDLATGKPQERPVSEWTEPIRALDYVISNHSVWFQFCLALETNSSGYVFQSNKPNPPETPMTPEDWLEFIEKNNLAPVLASIKDVAQRVSKTSLNILNELMIFALEIPENVCDTAIKALVIHGNYIQLGKHVDENRQLLQDCQGATQVHLYGGHTIFVDTNIILTDLDVVLLAPLWVKPTKNAGDLLLEGKSGLEHSPPSALPGSDRTGNSGNQGCTGKPGNPGGNIFGVMSQIQTLDILTINSVGGAGGKGQDGGAGGSGTLGRNADLPWASNAYWSANCDRDCWDDEKGVTHLHYYQYGITGYGGGAGGDGGKQGDGGIGVRPSIIQLLDTQNIDIVFNNGTTGQFGSGGRGGAGGPPGKGYECDHQRGIHLDCWSVDPYNGRGPGPDGKKGSDGVSQACPQNVPSPREITKWPEVLSYKALFFQHYNPVTIQFINELDSNVKAKEFFTLQTLAEESLVLESYVRNETTPKNRLTEVYKSLVERLNLYSQENPNLTPEHKKVVGMLLSLCRGSIINLEERLNSNIVVDVTLYFEIIIKEIESLKTVTALVAIQNTQASFNDDLQKKISQTTTFLDDIVTPAVNEAIGNIEGKLNSFEDELDGMITDTKQTLNDSMIMLRDAEKKEQKLKWIKMFAGVGKLAASLLPGNLSGGVGKGIDFVAAQLASKYSNEPLTIERLNALIKEAEALTLELERIEEAFQDQFIPLMESLFEYFKNVTESLSNGSNVGASEFSLTKWQLSTKIKECRNLLEELHASSLNQLPLINAVERLQDAMTISIDLYEGIDHYLETQSLGTYIATVYSAALGDINITDPELVHTVTNFERRFKENMLDEEIKLAVHAFKQWVFPFAKFYFPEGPTKGLARQNDPKAEIGDEQIRQMEHLSMELLKYKATIVGGQDTFIIETDFNSSYKTTKPFFTWKNNIWGSDIQSLLSGSKVNFNADVRSQGFSNWEAIKFKQIEINFHLNGATSEQQAEFDDIIEYFGISMTHSGLSNYRFQKDYFLMTGASQTIIYNFERDLNGNRLGTNDVYKKFKDGDFLLSPYTTWTIELKNVVPTNLQRKILRDHVSFDNLKSFLPYIDVELVGKGTYVNGNQALEAAGGDMKLDQWYQRGGYREELCYE